MFNWFYNSGSYRLLDTGFLGMVSTDDWADYIRPEDWTAELFREYPNGGISSNGGAIPLTGMSAAMGSSKVTDDPKFHWWNKVLAGQSYGFTANASIWNDAAFSNLYLTSYATNNATAGTRVYMKVSEAFASECVVGYQLGFFEITNILAFTMLLITGIEKSSDDASDNPRSVLSLRFLVADTGTASYGLGTCDRVTIMGSSFSEGTPLPEAMHYDPTDYDNYTQIHKNAIEQTGTALATKQRTAADFEEDKKEQGELHSIGLEWNTMFGVKSEVVGENGKKHRTSQGALPFMIENSPAANISDYRGHSDYTGMGWVEGGSDWLRNWLSDWSVWSPGEAMVLCGNYVITAVEKLAEYLGWQDLKTHQVDFGLSVTTWVTAHGDLHFKQHPLFAREAALKRSALIFHPRNVRKNYLEGRDTDFLEDINFKERKAGYAHMDAVLEGWLTECGYAFYKPKQWGWLSGFGVDN